MTLPLPNPAPRRVVLVDVGPEDARFVADLMRRPEISVDLVAAPPGAPQESRIDELAGIPVTRELSDLTHDRFALALVGASTTRQAQVEQVLAASGTPVLSLQVFLASELVGDRIDAFRPGRVAKPATPIAPPAAAPNVPTDSLAASLEAAMQPTHLPTNAAATPRDHEPARPSIASEATGGAEDSLGTMPLPDDPAALERALSRWLFLLGGGSAELHGGDSERIEWTVRTGPEDPLLQCIITLALNHDGPQVVSMLDGFQRGSLRAAWPFRTAFRRGVLAVSGLDPHQDRGRWERVAYELAEVWDKRDRERAGPSFPMVPGVQSGWLSVPSFRHRLLLAVERNRRDGLRFEVQRMTLNGSASCVEAVSQVLPQKLRGTDCVCRPWPATVLLLIAGPSNASTHVRGRITSLWQDTWRALGEANNPPDLAIESVELNKPESSEAFLETATSWLSTT